MDKPCQSVILLNMDTTLQTRQDLKTSRGPWMTLVF